MMEGPPRPSRGIGAAPNQSEIRATVRTIERSPDFPDKWLLELEILDARSISGPSFAAAGRAMSAFAFDPPSGLVPGAIIVAGAEFIGDARGGVLRLSGVRVADEDDHADE